MATTERLELPDGAWAEIRDPKKAPERLRQPVRAAALELQRSLPEDQRRGSVKVSEPEQTAELEVQSAFGAPPVEGLVDVSSDPPSTFLPSVENSELADEYNYVLICSVVTAWSFGDVTREVALDLPGDAFDELMSTIRALDKEASDGSDDSLASDPSAP